MFSAYKPLNKHLHSTLSPYDLLQLNWNRVPDDMEQRSG